MTGKDNKHPNPVALQQLQAVKALAQDLTALGHEDICAIDLLIALALNNLLLVYDGRPARRALPVGHDDIPS